VQTVAQASFDAWIRYYRPDAHTPNSTVSYYTKGALVALCLDLSLRREGRTTLDDVLRTLWQRSAGGPMDEALLREVLQDLGGRSFDAELDAWVHSTAELPLAELLQAHGIALQSDTPQPAQRLGLRVTEGSAVLVKTVLRGGLAEQAGMAPGDEWLGIEVQGQGWAQPPQATQRAQRRLDGPDGPALQAFDLDDGIGCIVITGNEKAFAAGADITAMASKTFMDAHKGNFITRNWETIRRVRKPVIAAVAALRWAAAANWP
jgi:hypothetical protein